MATFPLAPSRSFRPVCFYDPRHATQRAAVAVSACLAGENVRYDGTSKLLPVYALLHQELTLIPVCPEMGAGLGTPRPPVQLIEIEGAVRALGREDRALDVTSALHDFAKLSLRQLLNEHLLCGYLWKSRSPSCGLGSTPLFNANGIEVKRTSGIQAAYFQRQLPHLNHCEETALISEEAASVFILRCRLVFDVLSAPDTALPALHQHYAFLHECFDGRAVKNLNTVSETNGKTGYLAALLASCNQIPQDVLLKLFS